ncbi:MAG: response regulator, partial [Planctomycetota bacterium]
EIHAGGRASSKGEEQFELTVTDDGIGIAPEVMPLIFEPFYSTKQVGVGWGLGLATVQGIIESAGGQVLVRSEPNVGTTFRIVLSAADGPGEVKAAPEEDKAIPEGRETVLLCEDDDRIREQLRDVLAEHGYEVLVAADGDAATAIAEEFGGEIHLLLTDVVMPGANGPMIAMRLRKSRPDIKVLFISGYSADSLNRNGLDASEELFLPKPFRPSDAARKVREVLDS